MKKQKDGYYYEKVVTYKKKPEYWRLPIAIILLVLVIIVMGYDGPEEGSIFVEETPLAVKITMVVSMAITLLVGVVISLFFFFTSFGEGKEVKFRRIGK